MIETSTRKPDFMIGNIPVFGDLILAPMDGYTDSPFRQIARQCGAAVCYSEFINAMDVMNKHPFLYQHTTFSEVERPFAFQIYDNDPDRILSAALRLQELHPDFFDINLGCSEKSVSGRGAGAGLLREPTKVARIIKILSENIKIPITAKIRLGWDQSTRNYLEIARIVEENGGKAIAVHGRTKEQYFTGEADWDAIAEVKQAVKIPVIGNGDIHCANDIERLKNYSQCDAMMIGRATIGNPWIFSRKDRHQISSHQTRKTIHEHMKIMIEFYGSNRGLTLFRKHLNRYLEIYDVSRDQRGKLMTTTDPSRCFELVDEILKIENCEPLS